MDTHIPRAYTLRIYKLQKQVYEALGDLISFLTLTYTPTHPYYTCLYVSLSLPFSLTLSSLMSPFFSHRPHLLTHIEYIWEPNANTLK